MHGKLKLPHPLVFIVVLGILLYGRSHSFEYTNFDDNSLIQDNQDYITNISNIGDAFKKSVFITGSDVFYRPIETIWFILNAQIGGADLTIYHISSLLLHLLAVYLVFLLLVRLKYSQETSLLLSLFYLVHPLFTQAVAWVPGVVDVLAAVFIIPSFLFFLDFIESQQRKHFVLHLLFFALALYTKETAVALTVMCLGYLHLIKKEQLISYNKKVFVAGWGAVFCIWFLMRYSALDQQEHKGVATMVGSIFANLPSVLQYIGKILLPFNLSVMPVMADATYLFGAIALVGIIAALYFSKEKRSNWIIFSASWFVMFLLPTLIQTSEFRVHQAYEHRMYIPMIGILFLFAEMDWVKNFSTERMSNWIVASSLLIFFFVIAFRHENVFSNTKLFLDNAVSTSPGSSLAHRNLGIYYQDNNLLKEAAEEYQKSLALNPHERDLHNNLGVIYDSWGKKEMAEQEYLIEARMNSANAQALHNLGVLSAQRNEDAKAEEYFKKALAVRQNRGSLEQLALLYKKMNRREDLARVVQALKGMEGGSEEIENAQPIAATPPPADPIEYGRMLMQQGKMQDAVDVFNKVLMQDSTNAVALFNLGLIGYSAKQMDIAEKFWRKAVEIDPKYKDAFNNLAIALAQQGKKEEAEAVMKKLIASNPDYMDGYFNIANFYARNGNEEQAKFYIQELRKKGITKEQFVQRGIKLSPELEKIFEKD